jgi:hypothetical protein
MKALSKFQRYALAAISCSVALAVAWSIDAPSSCFLLAATVSLAWGPASYLLVYQQLPSTTSFCVRLQAPNSIRNGLLAHFWWPVCSWPF